MQNQRKWSIVNIDRKKWSEVQQKEMQMNEFLAKKQKLDIECQISLRRAISQTTKIVPDVVLPKAIKQEEKSQSISKEPY